MSAARKLSLVEEQQAISERWRAENLARENEIEEALAVARSLPDADEIADEQHLAALDRLQEDASRFPRFPWPSLDEIAGAIAPGELCMVGGRQGNGKSLFMQNVMSAFVDQGLRVLYFGLEQSAKILRIKWACQRRGISQRMILKPRLDEMGTTMLEAARDEVRQEMQRIREFGERAIFVPIRYVNAAELRRWTIGMHRKYATEVVIVDHIDHMDHGSGVNGPQELRETVKTAADLADKYGIAMLAASQIKRTNGDAVKLFTPPSVEDFFGGSSKEHISHVMLSLWRPLRSDLPIDELRKMQQEAKLGRRPEDRIYEPNVMGVRLVKDRLGDAPGKQTMLAVERGQLQEAPDLTHGIKTNHSL